ncbi:MAG: FAD-binding oxidoreductase [Phycisphaeraceae bacterium]|nr:FAD-binding oxidoreductase [Phycisphaeraceae bacterium]
MSTARVDIAIIGGGIAGLWCRWKLENAGYSTVLLEKSRLGNGQTAASQGILHRGVKYALGPDAAHAATAAEASARAWDDAMSGAGGPNLCGVDIVSESMLMWTDSGIISKLTGAIASKVLTSHVEAARSADIPSLLDARGRAVYCVAERVIEPISALRALFGAANGPVVSAEVETIAAASSGMCLRWGGTKIEAGAVVLCAGEGNEALLRLFGQPAEQMMQRRDLHMVFGRGAPELLFGHWIAAASDKPRLTITSAQADGAITWYLGGELAESGVSRNVDGQIEAARAELRHCFPKLDFDDWEFRTLRIARAEGKSSSGKRPDSPVVRRIAGTNAIAVWPTKLVTAPAAAEEVLGVVRSICEPSGSELGDIGHSDRPVYASIPWHSHAQTQH